MQLAWNSYNLIVINYSVLVPHFIETIPRVFGVVWEQTAEYRMNFWNTTPRFDLITCVLAWLLALLRARLPNWSLLKSTKTVRGLPTYANLITVIRRRTCKVFVFTQPIARLWLRWSGPSARAVACRWWGPWSIKSLHVLDIHRFRLRERRMPWQTQTQTDTSD